MNLVKKRFMVFGLFLFIIIGSLLSIKSATAGDFTKGYEFFILDTYYGDFDKDSFEDDIKIVVFFNSDYHGEIYSSLSLKINLPSGNSFYFTFYVSFSIDDSPIIITFTGCRRRYRGLPVGSQIA